jgi:glycosyltransferase involved in cell wall biosynthesis
MRLLLLQEERYFPTFGGSHKANRLLLEALARRGHRCLAVCPALNGNTPLAEFHATMAERGIVPEQPARWRFRYQLRGVEVDGLWTPDLTRRAAWIDRRIRSFRPDAVVVADDPRGYLLAPALTAAPGRVVFLVHNHRHLPFGPLAARPSVTRERLIRRARRVVAVSRHSAGYLARHGRIPATTLPVPLYDTGPPPPVGRFDNPWVTLVRPTAAKGVDLFLALADRFPTVEFAAVVTWGHAPEPGPLDALRRRPNVRLLDPVDDFGEILAKTKVLLVPSRFPENFPLVVVEAMANGVPVLASSRGGLPEAKLGVPHLLPVQPLGEVSEPPLEVGAWAMALGALLRDREEWEHCARASREAALAHLGRAGVGAWEELLASVAGAGTATGPADLPKPGPVSRSGPSRLRSRARAAP